MNALEVRRSHVSAATAPRRHLDGVAAAALISVLLLGLVLRFVGLETMPVWHDEVLTLLHAAGGGDRDLPFQLGDGGTFTAEQYRAIRRIEPTVGPWDVVVGVARNDPSQAPLYFVLLRVWSALFGESIGAMRSLSALIGVAVIPAMFWLGMLLFRDRRAALWSAAFAAVSPFHLLYSQELRQYSLWTLAAVVSSAVLLETLRRPTPLKWAGYALTVLLGIGVHLLFLLVLLSHLGYLLFRALEDRRAGRQAAIRPIAVFVVATVAGAVPMLPWLGVVVEAYRNAALYGGWALAPMERVRWAGSVVPGIASAFVDVTGLASRPESPVLTDLVTNPPVALVVLVALLTVGGAIYALHRLRIDARPEVWRFTIMLVLPTAIAIILPDLLFGTRRATAVRYLMPAFIGLQLAAAHLAATHVGAGGRGARPGRVVALSLLVGGALSCALISQSTTWWPKGDDRHNRDVAAEINRHRRPMVIVPFEGGMLIRSIGLSENLDPRVVVSVVPVGATPTVVAEYDGVFLLDARGQVRERLTADGRWRAEQLGIQNRIWRLVPGS